MPEFPRSATRPTTFPLDRSKTSAATLDASIMDKSDEPMCGDSKGCVDGRLDDCRKCEGALAGAVHNRCPAVCGHRSRDMSRSSTE